jgi:hypothetical protein
MKVLRMIPSGWTAALLIAAISAMCGCNKHVDNTAEFTNAINTYYAAHPVCLWKSSVKFPVQANSSDTSKTAPYDALVDQGLLVRTTAEKNVMIVASKQVNNYDISEKGRAAWVADPEQPGFGNFCYGRRKVSSIDSSTPTNDERGATTEVSYHYTVSDAPAWASAEETKNAYPEIRADLSGTRLGKALLIETNDGWKVARAGSVTAPAGS